MATRTTTDLCEKIYTAKAACAEAVDMAEALFRKAAASCPGAEL